MTTNSVIQILVRIASDGVVDARAFEPMRAVPVWDAVAAIEAYSERKGR